MRFQTLRLPTNSFSGSLHSGSVGGKTYKLFKFLTQTQKNKVVESNNESVNMMNDSDYEEKQSLEHLENCANAAREIEALDQYDDYNAKE